MTKMPLNLLLHVLVYCILHHFVQFWNFYLVLHCVMQFLNDGLLKNDDVA